jgi:hypothetical protein
VKSPYISNHHNQWERISIFKNVEFIKKRGSSGEETEISVPDSVDTGTRN